MRWDGFAALPDQLALRALRPSQVRELELNMDLRSINNLLEFLEKVFNGGSGELVGGSMMHAVGRAAVFRASPPPPRPARLPRCCPPGAASAVARLLLPPARLSFAPVSFPPSPCCPLLGVADFNAPVQKCLDRLTDSKWANSDILLVGGGRGGRDVRACVC